MLPNVYCVYTGCLYMYCSEGRVETVAFSCFISVILNKFNLYKYEDRAYILT